MKATGIVRRIDDLGRVVIPKEIRRTLRIREGDPLEIFTDREGEIILKKYSPMGELSDFAKEYAEALQSTTGHVVCITDRDNVVAVAGPAKKELTDKRIHASLEEIMQDKTTYQAGEGKENKVICVTSDELDAGKFESQIVVPIMAEGDCIGAVLYLAREGEEALGEVELQLARVAASFLGKQMEQ